MIEMTLWCLKTNLPSKLWLREAAVTRIATISDHYRHPPPPPLPLLDAPNIPINVMVSHLWCILRGGDLIADLRLSVVEQ